MRTLITSLMTAILLVYSFASFSAQKGNQEQLNGNIQSDIHQLKQDVKTTANDIEILRRDQINYRIEKDILKEAYSSNIQTINIVITIVLGVIGVLGYLGIKSIKEVKSDYTDELAELKELKANFESELHTLVNKQKEFENKISELATTNEKKDRRLKVLELTEKVSELMSSKQWRWALEYISLGLDIDRDNVPLLNQKTTCHGKLGEFASAIESCKRVIELEPESKSETNIMNLLEYTALSNQQSEFANIYASHKDKIDRYKNGNVFTYLSALALLIKGDLGKAIIILDAFVKKFPGATNKYLESWSFDEVSNVISRLPEGKQKDLLIKMVHFFDGKISSNDFEAYLVPP